MLNVSQLISIINGKLCKNNIKDIEALETAKHKDFTSVSIDSRHIEPHALFIAIIGEVFDGHNFINTLIAKEVEIAVVNRYIDTDTKIIQILVEDTKTALQKLA